MSGCEKTNGVGVSPVFDLERAGNFSISIQRVQAGIAWRGDLVWVTREDDRDAFAYCVAIIAHGFLTNIDTFTTWLEMNQQDRSSDLATYLGHRGWSSWGRRVVGPGCSRDRLL